MRNSASCVAPKARSHALSRFSYCSRDQVSDSLSLDSLTVTAASGVRGELPIVWQRASGLGVVWGKQMFTNLGIGARTRQSWSAAQNQLKHLGARLCTAEEKALLRTLPHANPYMRDTHVVEIATACQWLRSVGEMAAAEQLSQHRPPQPGAAGRITSSSDRQMQPTPRAVPSILNPPLPAQMVLSHPVPQLQDDWRVGSRRA